MEQQSVLKCVFLAVILLPISLVNCYKILTVYPTMSKSHTIISSAVMKGLAEAGHEVRVKCENEREGKTNSVLFVIR